MLRWKISDNEYRVVYGDLRAETIVDKEKLLDQALALSGAKMNSEQRQNALHILNLSEKDVILGLGVWLKINDGHYPKSLEPKSAIPQVDSLFGAKQAAGQKPDAKEAAQRKNDSMAVFYASAFYDQLTKENKEAAYYGDTVSFEDARKVLVRWKIADNRYRVVFGNLTARTVTGQELAELEKPNTP